MSYTFPKKQVVNDRDPKNQPQTALEDHAESVVEMCIDNPMMSLPLGRGPFEE